MKIVHKMSLGFLAVIILIWSVSYAANTIGKGTLQNTIGQGSAQLARELLGNIDRGIYYRLERWESYADSNKRLSNTLAKANQEFDIANRDEHIQQIDKDWRSGKNSPFIQGILNNTLSKRLQGRVSFYQEKKKYNVFPEVYVTNKYGGIIAATRRTSGYLQADEEWYHKATATKEAWVGEVEYDESAGTYACDFVINLYDEKHNFAGILKIVFNIKEIIDVVREAMLAEEQKGHEHAYYILMTRQGRTIYSSEDFTIFEDASHLLPAFAHQKQRFYFIEKDAPGAEQGLMAYAHSQGFKDYQGLGWVLLIRHESEEIFASVSQLQHSLLTMVLGVTTIAILMSFFVIRSVSNPLTKLTHTAAEIGKGNLAVRLAIKSKDEIGQLARAFQNMAIDLQETTVSKDYLHNIIQSMNETLVVVSADGTIERVNRATCDLLGYQPHELEENDVNMIFGQKGFPFNNSKVTQPANDAISNLETIYLTKDAREAPVLFSGSLMKDDGGRTLGTVCVGVDISERIKAETRLQKAKDELERSNSELEQFAYVASHDLQEPLRMVASYVQLIARRYKGKLDKDADDFIFFAVDGVERMKQMINDLLTYSRVGTQGRQFKLTDCDTVIDQALVNLKLAIAESGARINRTPVGMVMADPGQLIQLFQNLLGNAIKFKSDRPLEINVKADRQNGEIRFCVRDNGIGIESEYYERIFLIFQRLQGVHERPGTGIGLATSKKIVERHGGQIWVESEPGDEGATFYFTIPERRES